MKKNTNIPILNLPGTSSRSYENSLIHCESLNTLASFFGRSMQAHRHDRHYQLHYIKSGKVHLSLGEDEYNDEGPLIFLTPPPIPHSFITEPTAHGVVVTVHQSVIQDLLQALSKDELHLESICITLSQVSATLNHHKEQLLLGLKGINLATENNQAEHYSSTIMYWTKLIFINLIPLLEKIPAIRPSHHSYSQIFRTYLELIEENFKKHLPIDFYANQLNITEAKLNTICRIVSNSSSKQLIYDRIIQESKYLLNYTGMYVKEIAFELGFQDPAYFTRFFTNYIGLTPTKYRNSIHHSSLLERTHHKGN